MSDSKEKKPKPPESEDLPSSDSGDAAAADEPDGSNDRPKGESDAGPGGEDAVSRSGSGDERGDGSESESDLDLELEAKAGNEPENDLEPDLEDEDENETSGRTDREIAANFMHRPGTGAPEGPPQVRLPSFKDISVLEIASLAGVAALILAALLAFAFIWKGQVAAGRKIDAAASRLKESVDGKLLSLAALETYWKEPGPNDRVRANRELVPEVFVRLGTTTLSETGYLKAVFRDEEGTIRGDVTSHRVNNGNFADTSTPEMRIFSTDGFPEELDFVRYASGESDPWTVEILEGPSYAGSDWNRLTFIIIEAKRRDSSTPEN